jgi:predicted membrane-bound mannosyltransferase
MRIRQVRLTVILLFMLNLAVGSLFINEGIFHCDGVFLAQAVENTLKTGGLQPAIRGRYGSVIINTILYFPFFLAGENADFITRFSSVLFHALSIAALFLFINELFADYFQALFASLLFSFTPYYFSPNTYGKDHGMSVFFLLLAFYLLCRGLKQNTSFLVAISSFVLTFAISVKEAILVAVPLYFLLYLGPEISFSPFRVAIPKARLNPKLLLALLVPFLAVSGILFMGYLRSEFYKAVFVKDTSANNFMGLFSPTLKFALQDLLV